jgi:hypothetical protein
MADSSSPRMQVWGLPTATTSRAVPLTTRGQLVQIRRSFSKHEKKHEGSMYEKNLDFDFANLLSKPCPPPTTACPQDLRKNTEHGSSKPPSDPTVSVTLRVSHSRAEADLGPGRRITVYHYICCRGSQGALGGGGQRDMTIQISSALGKYLCRRSELIEMI